jgi:pilus assembly protein FimV
VYKRTALSLAICLASAYPVASNALGLGELQSNSHLNQPIRAKIELLSTNAAETGQLQVRLASPDVFSRVGIDRPAYLNNLRFTPQVQNGKPVILITSDQPVNEPFLNFLLEVSWPQGQLLKEYTVLLDPPVLMQAGDTTADNAASVRAEPAPNKNKGVVNRDQQRQQQQASRQVIQQQQQQRRQQQLQQQQQLRQQQLQQQQQQELLAAERALNAEQAGTRSVSTGGQKYRVKRGDTLSKISRKLRYRDMSTDQMMIALFRANPQAFRKSNMNNLKSGVIIRKPARNDISVVSRSESKKLIRQHYAQWKKYRSGSAKSTVAQTTSPVKGASQPTTVATHQSANKNANLKVMGSGANAADSNTVSASGTGSLADLRKQLALANETLASSKSENIELKSRVSKLESIIRKKDRLIVLRNERLAELEARLGVESTVKPSAENANPAINEGSDLQQHIGNVSSETDNLVLRGAENNESNQETQTPQAEATIETDNKATSTGKSEIPPAPIAEIGDPFSAENIANNAANNGEAASDQPNEKEEGILSILSSPLVTAIGGGSLLALILGWLFMRRRQHGTDVTGDKGYKTVDFDEQDYAETETLADTGFAEELDEDADHDSFPENHSEDDTLTDQSSFEEVSDEPLHEDELLQEADVYIVYGLYEQAEEELKKAIAQNPERLEYRHKLLENYQASNNPEAFAETATEFLKAEGSHKQQLWEQIVVLGKKIIPENDLFNEKSVAAAAAIVTGAGVASAAADSLFDENDSDITDLLDDVSEADDHVATEEAADLLDNDLEQSLSEFEKKDDSDSADATDFSATNENEESTDTDDLADNSETLDVDDFSDLDDLNLDDLDLDDEEFGLAENVLDFGAASAASNEKNDSDFGVDDKDAKKEDESGSLDMASLNLEINQDSGLDKILPTGNSYASGNSAASVEDEDDDFADDALSFLDLPDDDQDMQEAHIGTKLDLARAYLDMGDVEGARSTLEEVVVEGNDHQKREAEELLHQTG